MTSPSPKPGFAFRLMPSLTDVAFVMPLVYAFVAQGGAPRLLEGDTGWHIRTGEWILANGRVPDRDMFSYTKAGEQWFAWEWLWDVLFAMLHQRWGMAAVVLASVLVLCFTFALLFRLAHRSSGNAFLAMAVAHVAMAGSAVHWWARPHLFSLLFTVIFFSLLERVREGRTRLLWWLPALTALWTNLHGGFFIGIVLLGAYGAGELGAALLAREGRRRVVFVKSGMLYGLAAAGCAAASLVNPYTYRLHLHIWRYFSDSYHVENISEFQSLSFHSPEALTLELMLFLGAAAALWSLYRRRFAHAILLLGWAHLALYAARNIPIYLVLAAPVIATAMGEWLAALASFDVSTKLKRAAAAFERTAAEFGEKDRIPRTHLASLLAAVLMAALFFAPAPPASFRADFDAKSYPARALQTAGLFDRSSRIFADDEWGDYLIYRMYPAVKVFVDGRSDFYGGEFGRNYLGILGVAHDWESRLNRYSVDTMLLRADSALAGALKQSARWRPVYDDGVSIVFRPAGADPNSSIVRIDSGNFSGREVSRLTTTRDSKNTQLIQNTQRRTS